MALVVPGRHVLDVTTMDGTRRYQGKRQVENALAHLSTHVVYTMGSLTSMKETTGALQWTCHTWRGRGTRIVHDVSGTTVTSLRGTLNGSPCPFEDLLVVLDWLREYMVPPASISTMAWNLWRASLRRPVRIGADPDITRPALFGGRQEVREVRTYQHMACADITAAYPTAMAQGTYGLSLRPVSPSTALDPTVSGISRATVVVPNELTYGPLPYRHANTVVQFPRGQFSGTWTWCELDAAKEVGCTVVVRESWAPRATADLFGTWWAMVARGRALPGAAGVLAKSLANSLWGQFAMDGSDRGILRWADDQGERPFQLELEPRNLPHRWCVHIAAETTARVRSRLLLEGIYGSGPGHPVHVDTDGIIVRKSNAVPQPAGPEPGHWRIKAAMRKVDVRAPQLYRWSCDDCGKSHPEWHYVASGVADGLAPLLFNRAGHLGTKIAYHHVLDAVIPTTHIADRETISRYVTEAKELIKL